MFNDKNINRIDSKNFNIFKEKIINQNEISSNI